MKIKLVGIVASAIVVASLAFAQTMQVGSVAGEGEVIEERAKISRGQIDVDPNITSVSVLNDRNGQVVETPPNKRVVKSQERAQAYKVDNRTPWYVKVYKNGEFFGLLPPWGDLYTFGQPSKTLSGKDQLYAVAHFTDGSRRTWGPKAFSTKVSQVWKLKPAE